jgi:hypothetical protein
MSAVAVGTQRKTIKDMVLADYQIPKGVRFYKSLCFWELTLDIIMLTLGKMKKHIISLHIT